MWVPVAVWQVRLRTAVSVYAYVCVELLRVVLKKEIRRQRVLRDGREETIITEDIHVVQDDETSPDIDAAMHRVIDQFTGRSHSGESSVWPSNDLHRQLTSLTNF